MADMAARWEKARRDCADLSCTPGHRFHVAGCERKTQKVKVTNLNTGATSEATIDHGDFRAVKDVLDQHEKQAVLLKPEMDFSQEYWSQFEKGVFEERETTGAIERCRRFDPRTRTRCTLSPGHIHDGDSFSSTLPDGIESAWDIAFPVPEAAPARPWWKFWGRRG